MSSPSAKTRSRAVSAGGPAVCRALSVSVCRIHCPCWTAFRRDLCSLSASLSSSGVSGGNNQTVRNRQGADCLRWYCSLSTDPYSLRHATQVRVWARVRVGVTTWWLHARCTHRCLRLVKEERHRWQRKQASSICGVAGVGILAGTLSACRPWLHWDRSCCHWRAAPFNSLVQKRWAFLNGLDEVT